jgi:hypothetical protein
LRGDLIVLGIGGEKVEVEANLFLFLSWKNERASDIVVAALNTP